MKVILLENVKRIGSIGEVIDVKRGFARNYLITNKKALYASKENIKEVEKINGKEYIIEKLSTENDELYGSVKPTEISKHIHEKDKLDIQPEMIQLKKEIKSLGTFKVSVNLHTEVQAELNIKVISAEAIQ